MEYDPLEDLRVLQVESTASLAEVKKAYRKLIFVWHPDRHDHNGVEYVRAHRMAQKINGAYERISERHEEGVLPSSLPPGGKYETQHCYQGKSYQPGFPDPELTEIFVKSSFIISVAYDANNRVLYLKLLRGIYRYFEVPSSVFEAFLDSDSRGQFANKHIFKVFSSEFCG